MDDTDIAARLDIALDDVQRQLLILENHELVDLAKGFGKYGALLTPSGMETLEAANTQPPAARVIGF